MLPAAVVPKLTAHLERVRRLHASDVAAGFGRVLLPDALARKYPNADREWGWQWVFAATTISADPRFGAPQRCHLHVRGGTIDYRLSTVDCIPERFTRTCSTVAGTASRAPRTGCWRGHPGGAIPQATRHSAPAKEVSTPS